MPSYRCPVCSAITATSGRCAACRAAKKARRNADAPAAREIVAAWVAEHGAMCPGWGREPHPSSDLTASHRGSVADGAQGEFDGVLCRACNTRRGRR